MVPCRAYLVLASICLLTIALIEAADVPSASREARSISRPIVLRSSQQAGSGPADAVEVVEGGVLRYHANTAGQWGAVQFDFQPSGEWVVEHQDEITPGVRIVSTVRRRGAIIMRQETFSLDSKAPGARGDAFGEEVVLVRFQNRDAAEVKVVPRVIIVAEAGAVFQRQAKRVLANGSTALFSSQTVERARSLADGLTVEFYPLSIAGLGEKSIVFWIVRGDVTTTFPVDVPQAESLRDKMQRFWSDKRTTQ